MMVKADQRHLYVQVIERLKKDIESGIFKENERFPSEFELARTLGVSRATLREALRVLEEDKVIVRKHGVGTFVKPKPLFSSGIEQLIQCFLYDSRCRDGAGNDFYGRFRNGTM